MCAQQRLRSAWASAQSSLCAQWVAKDLSFLHADREDSNQTGRMPRLICDMPFCLFCHEAVHMLTTFLKWIAALRFYDVCLLGIIILKCIYSSFVQMRTNTYQQCYQFSNFIDWLIGLDWIDCCFTFQSTPLRSWWDPCLLINTTFTQLNVKLEPCSELLASSHSLKFVTALLQRHQADYLSNIISSDQLTHWRPVSL